MKRHPLHKTETSRTQMLEGLFLAIAGAVFSYVIEYLEPAEQIKKWLGREPAKLAFQKALSRAYTAFARQYPDYTASLFDQAFLTGTGASELAKLFTRHLNPDPALFAQAWGASIGFDAHSPFCKEATKPAADFLQWLEAELKSEAVFQPLFDSRALENIAQLEGQIEKLITELKRGCDTALEAAKDYERIVLEIDGDVTDSNIILGDNNQITVSNIYNHYHTGTFATLSDYYISPDDVFQRVRVDEFVGRDWLTAKVDAFLNDPNNRSGMFLLIGEAGVGKTSFMAHLVKQRRYLHLFAEQARGDANLRRALQSLGSQLVTRYQIDPYKGRDTLPQLVESPDFLDKLLRLAANKLTKDEKIVIVYDALDEAGTAPEGNVFGLPNVLPDNVYFILSQRPVSTRLPNVYTHNETLETRGDENLQDMEDYLKAAKDRPEIAGQLRSKNYSDEHFVQTLKEKSLGVWMYLHYIIEEIAKGLRAPLELENLPTGLVGYYADYWNNWREGKNGRGEGMQKWDELYSPILTTLAAAQEPITIEQLISWAGVQARQREVHRLLNENWRSFLTIRKAEKSFLYTYIPYHLSFRDFLTGKIDVTKLRPAESYLVEDLAEQTKEAHKRIVNVFREECNNVWHELVSKEYPRLHLTTHLDEAGEHKTLINLLTEGEENIAWADARYRKEETYAGYLNDLEHIWTWGDKNNDIAILIRCMLIENSIHSLANNISPNLLAELAKSGLWSYPRCLAVISQMPESNQQAEVIELLASSIPESLMEQTISLVHEIKDEHPRTRAFVALVPQIDDILILRVLSAAYDLKIKTARIDMYTALVPFLDDKLRANICTKALLETYELENEHNQARTFTALAPYINNKQQKKVLSTIRKFKEDYNRAKVLTALIPHLGKDIKTQVTYEACAAACTVNGSVRASAFSALAPLINNELKAQLVTVTRGIKDANERAQTLSVLYHHVNDEIKTQVLAEALSAIREIKGEYYRANAFTSLIPYLNNKDKTQVLSEALSAAHEISTEHDRIHTLISFAPHLNDKEKTQLFTSICEIKGKPDRARALATLAPHLTNNLREKALSEALIATREIEDEYAHVKVFSTLVPHINDELKAKLILATYKIRDDTTRARALLALVPHLNNGLRVQVLSDVLSIIRTTYRQSHVDIFVELIPHLDNKIKGQALSVACKFENEHDRARALSELTPYLNDDLKAQALSATSVIKNKGARLYATTALIPHLQGELKAQTIFDAFSTV